MNMVDGKYTCPVVKQMMEKIKEFAAVHDELEKRAQDEAQAQKEKQQQLAEQAQ